MKSAAEEAQLTVRNLAEVRAGVTLDALNAIVTHLGGLREGRKSVLFVSQGPPIGMSSASPNFERMRDVLRNANRGNVTIHALDPRPLGRVGFGGDFVLRHAVGHDGRPRHRQHQRSARQRSRRSSRMRARTTWWATRRRARKPTTASFTRSTSR